MAISDINFGLLHFKSVNLEEVKVKKIWYMCLEFVNLNRISGSDKGVLVKNAKIINDFYQKEFDSMLRENLSVKLSKCSAEWLAYPFFDKTCYEQLHDLRKKEVLHWLEMHGRDYFRQLNIWNVDWIK